MLIDDDDATNFIHQIIINKSNIAEQIVTALNGKQAIEFLTKNGEDANTENTLPSLIFLDINMPVMDGWGFIEAYKELSESIRKEIVIVMLTTSYDPDDKEKAKRIPEISEFEKKPLTFDMLNQLMEKYFPENS